LPPTFQDRVRFQIAVGMLFGMAILAALLIVCVAAGWMVVGEAKELALMVVALFGIVAPIIGFYFAAKERG
jgi:cytochrome bd-type quinol oxidase subunit 1